MGTSSLWQGTAIKIACLPTMRSDVAVDVAVVGFGIAHDPGSAAPHQPEETGAED